MLRIVLVIFLSWTLVAGFPDRDARIFDGRNAIPGEVPYIASLRFWGTTFHFAGGSLVNNRWVVTVASPLVGRLGSSVNIVVGTNMLNAGIVNRRSDIIRIHELYDGLTKRNDIACVRSATIITFTQFIAPIALSTLIVDDGTVGMIAGWGATQDTSGADSNVLQITDVTTAACVDNNSISFTQHHMCAGNGGNGDRVQPSAICTTDIGGPMVFANQLIGIAVWNPIRCGTELDGYNRVSSYRVWINGVVL